MLRGLGYRVSALHVAHGLRGAESDEDARFCRDLFGAEIVSVAEPGSTEAELRDLRYSLADRPAAGDRPHRLATRSSPSSTGSSPRGSPQGIKARREDGVVRPLLGALARGDARLLRRARARLPRGLVQPGTKRGLIRDEILPLLERLDPARATHLLSLATSAAAAAPLERTLAELLEP